MCLHVPSPRPRLDITVHVTKSDFAKVDLAALQKLTRETAGAHDDPLEKYWNQEQEAAAERARKVDETRRR